MSYDCSQITERTYCGALIQSLNDIVDIKRLGITHIIDCCEQNDEPLINAMVPADLRKLMAPGFRLQSASSISKLAYLYNPTADDGTPKPKEWFALSIDFGVGALAHQQYRLLTHCAAGVNRGPSTLYAILRALGLPRGMVIHLLWANRPQCMGGVRYREDAETALQALGWTATIETTD